MTRKRLWRAAVRLIAVLLLPLLAGVTFQGVSTALERRRFPRPGGMVDVGTHQLHIYCVGEGTPAVVLEAPALGFSAAWGAIQPAIGRVTRVCSYDRAGLGWSEDSGSLYNPGAAATELHTLLERAGERPPFVVAGHGLGAGFATLFASRFQDETPALILVDPPVAGQESPDRDGLVHYPGLLPWLARTGALRLTHTLSDATGGMPQPSRAVLSAFLSRPDHLSRGARELLRWDDVAARAVAAPLNRDIAITRLEGTGRRIAFLDPSSATPVVRAILDLVARVRAMKPTADADASSCCDSSRALQVMHVRQNAR
jgi:pimeloyl-ACP methyl ester carboxylesterase